MHFSLITPDLCFTESQNSQGWEGPLEISSPTPERLFLKRQNKTCHKKEIEQGLKNWKKLTKLSRK